MKKYIGALSITATFLGVAIGLLVKFPQLVHGAFIVTAIIAGFFLGKKWFPIIKDEVTK